MICRFVVVADRRERPGARDLVGGERERVLVQLERLCDREPPPRAVPGLEQRLERALPQRGVLGRAVSPG